MYQAYSDHLLEKEHAFIIGKFDKFESYSAKNSQGYRLFATFKFNGQTYTSVSNLDTRLSSKLEELFLKKLINNDVEIVYRPNQPSNSQVLLTQKAFNMYGRIMPDSLKWIDSLIKLSTQ